MKIEHLIQGYNHKGIEAKLKNEGLESPVIDFREGIYGAYYIDDDVVKSIKIFIPMLADTKNLENQINHTTYTLKVISFTIDLLSNITESERNTILKELGLFDKTFKTGKEIKHEDKIYTIETIENLISFSVVEEDTPLSNLKAKKS